MQVNKSEVFAYFRKVYLNKSWKNLGNCIKVLDYKREPQDIKSENNWIIDEKLAKKENPYSLCLSFVLCLQILQYLR